MRSAASLLLGGLLATGGVLAAAPAEAQAPEFTDPYGANNAFVDLNRSAMQLLAMAQRAQAAPPEVAVDIYAVVAEQLARAPQSWVVPIETRKTSPRIMDCW